MDQKFLEYLATMGIGGALASLIFVFYRKDIKQYTELWKMATEQFTSIVKENTASNTKLITLIETQERNAIRKSDIEVLIDNRIRDFNHNPKT